MKTTAYESIGEVATVTGSLCRSCKNPGLKSFLDLGMSPIADSLVSDLQLGEPDPVYPLEVAFCPNCSLVQILETISPDTLFCRDYPYYSSFSEYWLEHSRLHADALIEKLSLAPGNLVVEVASNDGYLLKNFLNQGIDVLGIDPADGPASTAREAGIETMDAFFTSDLAENLRNKGIRPDIIIANNVLAHVADTRGFVTGLRTLINPGGLISIEVPYIRDLIEMAEFDTIYHQHLCYFSLTAIVNLLSTAGLYVNDVFRLPSHGGSLRIYAGTNGAHSAAVATLLSEEREAGLDRLSYYADFAGRVQTVRDELVAQLDALKKQGYRIAGYGAAAKACTLLNYCRIDGSTLDFIVDRNRHKHGLHMSGVRIPILDTDELLKEQPDYVLLLCWNLADEILSQEHEYRERGGKFIIPLPNVKVL
jgi:SAM-dependent methyltransferase